MAQVEVRLVETTPFEGQKPGTSGLRKRVAVFKDGYYLHNFIQSIFDVLPADDVKEATLLISGDGRYYNREAILIATNLAFANGVQRVWIGKGGLMSTPAASCVIRERENGVAKGGILFTASHNPGGPNADFGVKYNCANGGPALESLTNAIYDNTKIIKQFKTCSISSLDIDTLGIQKFGNKIVEVIDPVEDWLKSMKQIFDFSSIGRLLARKDFSMVYDGMNGVAGPYAEALFCAALGASRKVLKSCVPSPDFQGCHPDPNLTYASELVNIMAVFDTSKADQAPDFGAAGDGDNDRNMILGAGFFVVPSDSVAVIASYAARCIPYFANGLKGLSRSLPTSCALDMVAKELQVPLYEVPTGWKFFCNLMDAGQLSICGEESFGTSSDHIREKDGLWAVLSWLSILAFRNPDPTKPLVSVKQIVEEFWKKYGRKYYMRYDFEEVDAAAAHRLMDHLTELAFNGAAHLVTNTKLSAKAAATLSAMRPTMMDSFTYVDPIDHSVSPNQGIRLVFEDGSRIVWRHSGTGSVGITIRVYFEQHESDPNRLTLETADVLKPLTELAAEISQVEAITGRSEPDVIT